MRLRLRNRQERMEALEQQYLPKEQAASLLQLALGVPLVQAIVGEPGARGMRFVFFKYFAVESYLCFEEPQLKPWRGIRFVFWRTPPRQSPSAGWHVWKGLIRIGSTYAVGRVHAQYRQDWKGNSRRAAQQHQQSGSVIRMVPLKEFSVAYHQSKHTDLLLRQGMIWVARDHLKVHPEDVFILLAYTKEGALGGGAIFIDYPDIHSSHYVASFLTPLGRAHDFGYAYIDWWYRHMVEQKLMWAEFGIMWQPGDPAGWRGSTAFKSRFNPILYTYTRYVKITMQ